MDWKAGLIALIFSFLCSTGSKAQTSLDTADFPYWVEMMQDESVNFYDVQRAFYTWLGKHPEALTQKGSGVKVYKRWEYATSLRIAPDGSRISLENVSDEVKGFIKDRSNNMNGQMRGVRPGFNPGGKWIEIGPFNMPGNKTFQPNGMGRINDIAFHPTDVKTIYIGAPSGGLWKTADSGSTWTPLTDSLATLGVSSIAIDRNSPSTIYIGTGDRDANDAPGLGVWKSTNGGSTFNSISSSAMSNLSVAKLLLDPNNSSVIVAATSGGIYRTTNGGTSWTRTSSNTNYYKDMAFRPGNPDVVYATENGRFWRSTDGGANWTQITSGLSTAYRGVIGVTPADSNMVYFVTTNVSTFKALYISTDGGSNFSMQSDSPNIMDYSTDGSGTSGQAWYDLAVAVDTANPGSVYVGGINIFKSADSGQTWNSVAHWLGNNGVPAMHADIHVMKINSLNNRLYAGNDGGLYYTANGGTSWKEISSGLRISQIYKIGQSATRADMMIAGFQDNGSAQINKNKWNTVLGGDGMECIIDPTDTNYQYTELYYGSIYGSTNAGNTYFSKAIGGKNVGNITESGDWVTPYILHKSNSKIMFAGYNNLWKCSDVRASSPSWTQISNNLANSNSFYIKVLEQSSKDVDLLFMARGDKRLFRSKNVNSSSPVWKDLTDSLPITNGTILDIKTHPQYANAVYIIQNRNIYLSVDTGNSWTAITGSLPNIPMYTLAIDKNSYSGIYVGTEAGVYFMDSTMSDWVPFYDGLPTATRVFELEIYNDSTNSENSLIKAGTYGRGAWQSELYAAVIPVVDFSIDSTMQCLAGNQFKFTDNSTVSSGIIDEWLWDFGDGTTSTNQDPTKSYTSAGTYIVKLIATSEYGPASNTTKTVTVYPQPKAAFTVSNSAQCVAGNSFGFTDGSTIGAGSISAYLWDFGNGQTSSSKDPNHSYSSAGAYKVILKVTSDKGCTDTISKVITVHPKPNVSFTIANACSGKNISITNTSLISSGSITGWLWRFGDNTTSSANLPVKSYSSPGTYTVWLIATTDKGCKDSVSKTITIYQGSFPAILYASNCVDSLIKFTAVNLVPGITITSYSWDFGDGTTSNASNPSKKYNAAGSYTINLSLTTSNGCINSATETVDVFPSPVVGFDIQNGCLNDNFAFTNTSSIATGYSIQSYLWRFGDGTTGSGTSPVKKYSSPGVYDVTLIATSNKGCKDSLIKKLVVNPDPEASFTYNNRCQDSAISFTNTSTIASGGNISTYSWDFGDGKSSASVNPTHLYASAGSYKVQLKAISDSGCVDSVSHMIDVYPKPQLSFTVSDKCHYDSVRVTNTSSGNIVKYEWDFGDGSPVVNIASPAHKYSDTGSYTIKLTALTDKGCTDTMTKTVQVFDVPLASFTTSINCEGEATSFDNTSTGNGNLQYTWDFGDGNTSSQEAPSHLYTHPGIYQIKLTVSNDNGCMDTAFATATVLITPKIDIIAQNACFGSPVSFNPDVLPGSDSIDAWLWLFGDGDSSNLKAPVHTYTDSGLYEVVLIVIGKKTCPDTIRKTITIFSLPQVDYNATDVCLGHTTSFINLSTVASSYLWDFGDGETSVLKHPSHVYKQPGKHQVRLQVTDTNGCIRSMTKQVQVYELPKASFAVANTCLGRPIEFINTSTIGGGDSIVSTLWNFGDGNTLSHNGDVSHVYGFQGIYQVTVVATSVNGCSDTFRNTISLNASPKADIFSLDSICMLESMSFSDVSTISNGSITSWLWNFGDNSNSTQRNPEHVYQNPGTYNVWLKIASDSGCVDSVMKTIAVYPLPDSKFSISKVKDRLYHFGLDNKGMGTANWDFGDGNTGLGDTISHLYSADASYVIKLTLEDKHGCISVTADTLEINTAIVTEKYRTPLKFNIHPNPFNESFNISYELTRSTKVSIGIIDVTGKEITILEPQMQVSGEHKLNVAGPDLNLSGGVYTVKFMAEGETLYRKLVHVR